MKICVVGTGYVGLVTGTCFAEMGNTVVCVDTDQKKVAMMQSGKVPIYEPGLEELFEKNIAEGRLHFTTDIREGVQDAKVIFLALPTPPAEDGSADLKYILGVAEDLSSLIDDYVVIVDKSTVPVGTADKVKQVIASNTKRPFDVVSNPEFLKEGFAIYDFMNPDRIVIGAENDKARQIMTELYRPLTANGSELVVMDIRSAEMTKYAANAFLATKISFMNEIANLCELVGADVDSVRLGIGSDSRIGHKFLYPGLGYGGSCFPKDVMALHKIAQDKKYDFRILGAVSSVNALQKKQFFAKINNKYGDNLRGKTFAVWGLAFKADTDDIRESPAIAIVKELLSRGVNVVGYDPEAMENTKRLFGEIEHLSFAADQYTALNSADALIIATEWNVFKEPDFEKMKAMMNEAVIFDGRNIYDLDTMREKEFTYISVGRQDV